MQWLLGPTILVVVVVVVLGGGLSWLEERLTDPAPQIARLDGLTIPSSWEDVGTVYSPSLLFGSRVARFYLIDSAPDDLVAPVLQIVEDAGWEIDAPVSPEDVCRPNGRGGPVTCYLHATVERSSASIVIWDRDEDGTYHLDNDETRVSSPGLSMVRVTIGY